MGAGRPHRPPWPPAAWSHIQASGRSHGRPSIGISSSKFNLNHWHENEGPKPGAGRPDWTQNQTAFQESASTEVCKADSNSSSASVRTRCKLAIEAERTSSKRLLEDSASLESQPRRGLAFQRPGALKSARQRTGSALPGHVPTPLVHSACTHGALCVHPRKHDSRVGGRPAHAPGSILIGRCS